MIKKINNASRISLLAILLMLLIQNIPIAEAEAQTPYQIIDIQSDFHGKMIEAGDTVTFPITIRNLGNIIADHHILYRAFGKARDWDIRFEAAGRKIHRISIPPQGSRTINVIIETPGNASIGEHRIDIIFHDGRLTLYVQITKTHEGKPGTLMLTTVNRRGENIRGAIVSAYRNNRQVNQMRTTAAGRLEMDLGEGVYDIKFERAGYKIKWERDVRIRVGRNTDLRNVLLEYEPFAAEIRVDAPSKTITAGIRPVYALTINNIGEFHDTYTIHVVGLPHGWHARYMVRGTTVEITKIFIRSGESTNLNLEIIPPHGVRIGEYNFTAVVESSALEYNEPLSLNIQGTIAMRVDFDRYRTEITGRDTAAFEVTVRNHGIGASLTNIRPNVSAPRGWRVDISPRTTAHIAPGERGVFNVVVTPPADIVAGEYRLRMTVESDQARQEIEFRVIVEEEAFIAFYGIAILIIVAIGLWVMFKKFGRR